MNKFLILVGRVQELEDMTLKQQKEVTEESGYALHNKKGKFSDSDLPRGNRALEEGEQATKITKHVPNSEEV